MNIPFLLDEQLRGPLAKALFRNNTYAIDNIEFICVGDHVDLPLGISDESILEWCELNSYLLVSLDRRTMRKHFEDHLAAGKNSPGVFLIRANTTIPLILEHLKLIAKASESYEWQNGLFYLPFAD